ncbi:hypothetical protein MMC28_006255 [Mycoblastus sanguinarius]|nr:hypothetical protein [Mycoblastus sanguinarius]
MSDEPALPENLSLPSSQSHSPHDISSQYEIPAPQAFTSFASLKDRIKQHYEVCSEYYYSLWGEHIHHGYFLLPADTKEVAQTRLIDLLLELSGLSPGSTVLDVGCGLGGTTRYLAKMAGCKVTGITISGQQVKIAKQLTEKEASESDADGFITIGEGRVRYLELDAERIGDHFRDPPNKASFDYVWISEAMSHLPDKRLFFRNASRLLDCGGKLVIADWFKAEELTSVQLEADIKPIEDGMLLPPLSSTTEYVAFAQEASLSTFADPLDISKYVAKTWDISWTLIQSPALWAFALSQGRDGIAFLQAFRAMRRGYANGTFRYAVMVFQKKP